MRCSDIYLRGPLDIRHLFLLIIKDGYLQVLKIVLLKITVSMLSIKCCEELIISINQMNVGEKISNSG